MKIVHFEGEGIGMMLGIREYIVVLEDDEADAEDHICIGFKIVSETVIDDLPSSFPVESMLVKKY